MTQWFGKEEILEYHHRLEYRYTNEKPGAMRDSKGKGARLTRSYVKRMRGGEDEN
jgi:hypothetical protein